MENTSAAIHIILGGGRCSEKNYLDVSYVSTYIIRSDGGITSQCDTVAGQQSRLARFEFPQPATTGPASPAVLSELLSGDGQMIEKTVRLNYMINLRAQPSVPFT